MFRAWWIAAVAVMAMTTTTWAFDAVGTIQKIDVAGRTLHVQANGKDRQVAIADDVRVLDSEGKPLGDGLKSTELAAGATVTLSIDRGDKGPTVTSIRLGGEAGKPARQPGGGRRASGEGKPSVGLVPLDQMSASERYQGEDGGLYGKGENTPPAAQAKAAKQATAEIVPRNAAGQPDADGVIVLVSISMSNATQEFSTFKQVADDDREKSDKLVIVDCAQGGQAMAQWVDPRARPWEVAEQRLRAAQVSNAQVQAAWIKLANKAPSGDLAEHGRQLEKDTVAVVENAKAMFPNLKLAFLSSRTYGGYSGGSLNPEPYAYESAYAVRWLIQDQIAGDQRLAYAGKDAKAPVLLWGPYLWADGVTARKSDGLAWQRSDFGPDATHPSATGRQKVAEQLLTFFKKDPYARPWFVGK